MSDIEDKVFTKKDAELWANLPTKKEADLWPILKAVLSAYGWEAFRVENSVLLGWPDVVAHRREDGKTIYIELKKNRGLQVKYRPGQLGLLKRFRQIRVLSFVCAEKDGDIYLLEPKEKFSVSDYTKHTHVSTAISYIGR
jgi:Holliday junction resolvase